MKLHVVLFRNPVRNQAIPTEYIIAITAMKMGWDVRFSLKPDYKWPDILLFTHAWKEQTPECRPLKIQWWFDLLWRDPTKIIERQSLWHQDVMKSMDIVLMRERGLFGHYRRLGINTQYLDQACWRAAHLEESNPQKPRDVADVGFTGSYYPEGGRIDLIRHLARLFNTHVWSNASPIKKNIGWSSVAGVTLHPAIFHGQLRCVAEICKVVVATSFRNDIDGYWSVRLWQLLASGACVLHAYTPGLERVVQEGVHCLFFEGYTEAIRQCKYLLARPKLRGQMAREGRRLALSHHAYENRLAELKRIISQCGTFIGMKN